MSESKKHIDIDDIQLTRFIMGDTSNDETNTIISLIENDTDIYERYRELNERVSRYDEEFLENKFNPDKARQKFLEHIAETPENKIPFGKNVYNNWLKIAAILLIIVSPTILLLVLRNNQITLSSMNNKIEAYVIPDGSKVWLNRNSVFKFPRRFKKPERLVILSGEAYFEVQHDPNRPFLIMIEDITIKVIGTSFNVRAYPGEELISVAVNEGTVKIDRPAVKEEILLKKGNSVTFDKSTSHMEFKETGDLNYQSWKTGVFEFRETKLCEVIRALNEYYNINIVLADADLGDREISSTFENESLDSILEVLSFIHNLSVERRDSSILLSSHY